MVEVRKWKVCWLNWYLLVDRKSYFLMIYMPDGVFHPTYLCEIEKKIETNYYVSLRHVYSTTFETDEQITYATLDD